MNKTNDMVTCDIQVMAEASGKTLQSCTNTVQILCQCGQPKTVAEPEYQICRYDMDGNIVWAICPHGNMVIDRRMEGMERI